VTAPSHPALECRSITKRFGSLVANDGIDFDVQRGEIHGLIGENGAGKSTLMNIFYGMLEPDAGHIAVNGHQVIFRSCADAIRAGIGMVFQHYLLVERFTVAQNVLLGKEPVHGAFLDASTALATVAALTDRYGFSVDPSSHVEDLGVGARQQVELLRVLSRDPEIVILDEPTAALSLSERDRLFDVMTSLRKQGRAIIFITHKLKEVMRVCDRVTVLRGGRVYGTVTRSAADTDTLASLMVGDLKPPATLHRTATTRSVVLDISDLSVAGSLATAGLHHISLRGYGGEVVGVAGVEGNGQAELAEALFGLRAVTSGRITMDARDITRATAQERRRAGMRYVPPDRQGEGLLLDFAAPENALVGEPNVNRLGLLDVALGRRRAERIASDFAIAHYDETTPLRRYSGGTQQKFLIGRETSNVPRVLIACAPTRGVDIGAAESIYTRVREMQFAGACVILISYDLDEVRRLSDRILVFHNGTIAGELLPDQADDTTLGRMMSGAHA
jgi:simple sugar transport system ATP-binding protein